MKKHILKGAGQPGLHALLTAGRAGNCPLRQREQLSSSTNTSGEVGKEGRRQESRRKRKILDSVTVIQPKYCGRTEGALKVASL